MAVSVSNIFVPIILTQGEDDAVEGTQIALEGVRSIKVVSAYSLQQNVCNRYSKV